MKFIDLPQLGQPLEGGIFAGVITQQDGQQCTSRKSYGGSAVAVRYVKLEE